MTALLINPLNAADTILIGSYTSTGPASQQSSISGTVSVTGSPSRNYYLRLRWTFSDATWTSCDWNDLGVGSPTVTCGGYNP